MSEWQPIETAPRDGRRVLLYWDGHVVCGNWDEDRYANRPRPYWRHDMERIFGIRALRATPPTHWRPLPAPPEPSR